MNIRIIAASVLALGLLAPAAFAAENYNCKTGQSEKADYGDCMSNMSSTAKMTSKNAFSAFVGKSMQRASIGDFIDETAEEKNQRSSN